jgi:hypothetical protein
MHYDEIADVPVLTPRDLVVEHLTLTGNAADNECRVCKAKFESDEEFQDHCWRTHGDVISDFLKHRPVNYSEGTFAAAFSYGVMCMNEIVIGQICHGCIACGICKIGFDDPGELFVHLFHRHTKLCAVSSKTIEIWPLTAVDLQSDLQDVLKRCCMTASLRTLVESGIYEFTDETKRCLECRIDLASDEGAWAHASKFHLVVIF